MSGRWLAARTTAAGHPVDIATGKVFTEFVDLVLHGPVPFSLEIA